MTEPLRCCREAPMSFDIIRQELTELVVELRKSHSLRRRFGGLFRQVVPRWQVAHEVRTALLPGFREHPAYARAGRRLRDSDLVKDLLREGPIEHLRAPRSIENFLDRFLLFVFTEAGGSEQFQQALTHGLDLLREQLLAPMLYFECWVLLWGVEVEEPPWRLGDGIALGPWDAAFRGYDWSLALVEERARLGDPGCAALRVVEIPRGDVTTMGRDHTEAILGSLVLPQRLLAAMELLDCGEVEWWELNCFVRGFLYSGATIGPSSMRRAPRARRVGPTLSLKKVQERRLGLYLQDLGPAVWKRLHLALQRLHSADERESWEDKVLDWSIALEVALLPDSSHELGKTMASRGAWLLEPDDPCQRREIFDGLRRLYRLRSSIVHGREPPAKDTAWVRSGAPRTLVRKVARELVKRYARMDRAGEVLDLDWTALTLGAG